MTTVADGLFQYGGMPVGFGIPPLMGKDSKVFFVDPLNGLDGNPGTAKLPFATLYKGHKMCTAGQNDIVFLIGGASSTSFAILSLANALTNDATATAGTLLWNKAATHLIGISAPGTGQRASIRAPQSTYTGGSGGTFASNAFITVSVNGCYFGNLSMMNDFTTGGSGEILLTVSGSYNVFDNCSIYGFGNGASAGGAASRVLKLGGGGENSFLNCQIGVDTVTRAAANYNVEFVSGSARNRFKKCVFPVHTSDATAGIGLLTGAALSRWVLFDDCLFHSTVHQSGTIITNAFVSTTATPGGSVILSHCNSIGVDEWGDANSKGVLYVDNVGGAATAGMMMHPTTSTAP